jgi:hypothetical protein
MAIRLTFVALSCAASLGWASSPEHAAGPTRATVPTIAQVVTNSESAWRKPRPEAKEPAPRAPAGTPARSAVDPAVTHERAFDRGSVEPEPVVTTLPVRVRPEPVADELSVHSRARAADVGLVPNEAETRCMRTEGQMRCTPLYK